MQNDPLLLYSLEDMAVLNYLFQKCLGKPPQKLGIQNGVFLRIFKLCFIDFTGYRTYHDWSEYSQSSLLSPCVIFTFSFFTQ